jgi:hypothetical protein
MEVPTRTERPDPNEELSVAESSQATGIPARTIRAAAQRGALTGRIVNGGYLIRRADLSTYAADHKTRGPNAKAIA